MRPDRLYPSDIVEAADLIAAFVADQTEESFQRDPRTWSAVLYQLVIIGEAAGEISDHFRNRYPYVPWRKAIGMRNFAVHGYFAVQLSIVWETATQDVPPLQEQIAGILATEYPEEQP